MSVGFQCMPLFCLLCMISFCTPEGLNIFKQKDVKQMEKNRTIQLNEDEVIIKRYKVRTVGNRDASIETTIPREAFEREARRQGMTVQEAVNRLKAVWRFNSFQGLYLSFEEASPQTRK